MRTGYVLRCLEAVYRLLRLADPAAGFALVSLHIPPTTMTWATETRMYDPAERQARTIALTGPARHFRRIVSTFPKFPSSRTPLDNIAACHGDV